MKLQSFYFLLVWVIYLFKKSFQIDHNDQIFSDKEFKWIISMSLKAKHSGVLFPKSLKWKGIFCMSGWPDIQRAMSKSTFVLQQKKNGSIFIVVPKCTFFFEVLTITKKICVWIMRARFYFMQKNICIWMTSLVMTLYDRCKFPYFLWCKL